MKLINAEVLLMIDHSKECKNCGCKSGVKKKGENNYRCSNCKTFV